MDKDTAKNIKISRSYGKRLLDMLKAARLVARNKKEKQIIQDKIKDIKERIA